MVIKLYVQNKQGKKLISSASKHYNLCNFAAFLDSIFQQNTFTEYLEKRSQVTRLIFVVELRCQAEKNHRMLFVASLLGVGTNSPQQCHLIQGCKLQC